MERPLALLITLGGLSVGLVMIASPIIFGDWGTTSQPAVTTAPASISTASAVNSKTQLPKEQNKRFERCRANVKKAMGLDLIYDLRIDRFPPQVVVGPAFYEVSLDTKQVFADNVNCFLMAGDHKYLNFDLLDYRSGHVVAKYSYGKLKVM